MKNDRHQDTKHVDELVSGYIDGELTQQQRQQVEVHCNTCPQCRKTLDELKSLRKAVGNARLSELGEDKWRESMQDTTTTVTRGIGWFLLVGGLLIIGGIGLIEFISSSSMSVGEKLLAASVYGGLLALFGSVLRQRLIERKTDKYKDVEI